MILLEIALGIAAFYAGAAYLWIAYLFLTGRTFERDEAQIELISFHLGLCFILAAGFLGLLVK